MSTLVTGDALKTAVRDQTFVKGGEAGAVETVKYDLRLGSTVLKAAYGLPMDIERIPEEKRWIEPGEVVFVVTKEQLELPPDMIAVLSPKRAITHRGIMVLGGFAIDPGYSGLLWFGLHNFASSRYPLISGTKLIACMFYKLAADEADNFQCITGDAVTGFPDDLIELIKNYKPVELKGIQDELATIKADFSDLKKSFGDDKAWRDDFKKDLAEHNKQLGLLIEGLKDEKEVRRREDDKITGKLDSMSNWFFGAKMIWLAFGAVVLIIVGAVVGPMVPKTLSYLAQVSGGSNPPAAAPARPSPPSIAPGTSR
jgi:deoxycytidine triphosphate deaminase